LIRQSRLSDGKGHSCHHRCREATSNDFCCWTFVSGFLTHHSICTGHIWEYFYKKFLATDCTPPNVFYFHFIFIEIFIFFHVWFEGFFSNELIIIFFVFFHFIYHCFFHLFLIFSFVDHLFIMCWSFVDHFGWSFVDHLSIICWSFVYHLLIICLSCVDHLSIICWSCLSFVILSFVPWVVWVDPPTCGRDHKLLQLGLTDSLTMTTATGLEKDRAFLSGWIFECWFGNGQRKRKTQTKERMIHDSEWPWEVNIIHISLILL